jgi:hypothetical protein
VAEGPPLGSTGTAGVSPAVPVVSISRRWTTTACSKELLRTFFVEFVELFLPEVDACLGRGTIEFPDKRRNVRGRGRIRTDE